jgi:hypothetical protein
MAINIPGLNGLNGINDPQQQQRLLEYLDIFENAQNAFTDALETWRGAFDGVADQPTSPWSLEPLPPRELVETTFGFVERVVASQKQLAIAFLEAAVPEAA